MAKALNHNRPVLATRGKEVENKYRERNEWISTRRLMKAKSWQEFIVMPPARKPTR
jgi:hypothetical protein